MKKHLCFKGYYQEKTVAMTENIYKSYIRYMDVDKEINKVVEYRIYRELLQYKNKKITQFKKWVKDLKRFISKEVKQMANKYMKRISPSSVIKEMQINEMALTPIMAIIKKTDKNRCCKCRETETLIDF